MSASPVALALAHAATQEVRPYGSDSADLLPLNLPIHIAAMVSISCPLSASQIQQIFSHAVGLMRLEMTRPITPEDLR